MKAPVLTAIKRQLAEHPLPVLKKTVARIVALASTLKSDIGQLAQTILQDQSFTAKVLAVANSAYYKHRPEPITTVTRAIIQIGYTTLRDIAVAAELTEMAQKRMPHGINLNRLLAKAFVAAHQAKTIGEAVHLNHAEEIFTHTLLQSIGEFALAYYMPQEYRQIEKLIQQGQSPDTAYHQVLNISAEDLKSAIMEACTLPPEMAVIAPNWASAESWTEQERTQAIAALCSEVSHILFAPQTADFSGHLNDLLGKAAKALGVKRESLEQLIAEGFRKGCTFGQSLELDPASFLPAVSETGSDKHEIHPLIESCMKIVEPLVAASLDQPSPVAPADAIGSAGLLVHVLTDLTHHVMTAPDLNTVLTCVLEGLHRAVGFDHAVVVLTVPGKSVAAGRCGAGPDVPSLLSHFTISTEPKDNLLAHCMAMNKPLRISAGEKPPVPLPPAIMTAMRPTGIALAPLATSDHPIGIIWADRTSDDIDDVMWDAFQLFGLQANLALLRLAGKH
jgi:HD-like signal output (HDOD) protein